MIRGFLLLSIGVSLYANSEYVPFSKFSQSQQIKYNFKKGEVSNTKDIESTNRIVPKVMKVVESNDIEKEKILHINENQNTKIINKYKNENILRNELKYIEKSSTSNFSIAPKLTYTYLRHDGDYPGKIGLKDNENILVPEISLAYKNHILKAEGMSTKGHFKRVLIGGGDLDTKTSWYKLNYLYKYQNAKIGLAYNSYKMKWNPIVSNVPLSVNNKRTFPSLEVHFKNEKDKLQVEYGASLGKSDSIYLAYDYYVNLGYKIFKNDDLIISAGYRNRAIEFDSLKFEYYGPTISLSSTF